MSDEDFELVHDRICWPLVKACDISSDGPSGSFLALTREEQMFLAMWHLEAQVSNGGFLQFYFNLGGWLAEIALAGYEAVGLDEHAALVRKSIKIAERETSDGAAVIAEKLSGLEDPTFFEAYEGLTKASLLPNLDDWWYALDRRNDGLAAKAAFVRAHSSAFPRVLPER